MATDVGETKDAGHFARRLDLPIAIIDKRRSGDDERAEAVAVIGDIEGKRCLLVDDEMRRAAASSAPPTSSSIMVRSASRRRWCTLVSGRAIERLAASRLEHLLVTNTIPLRHASAKVEVLSVAPLLAEAITRIHDGRSVSALFG